VTFSDLKQQFLVGFREIGNPFYFLHDVEKFTDNIDLQKYTQILDANLRPFVAEDFVGRRVGYSRMTPHC